MQAEFFPARLLPLVHEPPYEYVKRLYLKEEEFLEDLYETVDAVLPLLGVDWRPNFSCTERERQRRAMLLATGRLEDVTFDKAVVFHVRGEFSSLQLHLRSTFRLLIVRIHWVGAELVFERLLDSAPSLQLSY